MSIDWSADLETGHPAIDSQHKELFNRMNGLLKATGAGAGKAEIAKTLEFLEEYVVTHFEEEEKAMQQTNFDGYMAHKSHHTTFLKTMFDLKIQFEKEGASLSLTLLTQRKVVDWVVTHIKKVDKIFAAYLKKTGYEWDQ